MTDKQIYLALGAILILCILFPQSLGVLGWILAIPAALWTNRILEKKFPRFPAGVATFIIFWTIFSIIALLVATKHGYHSPDTLMQDQRGYY
jgi:hypothetical protein